MRGFLLGTVFCNVALWGLAAVLAWVRDGPFTEMPEEMLMIVGLFGTAGGMTSLFAANGPIGHLSAIDRNHEPRRGLVLLVSGILTLGLSIWFHYHPGLLRCVLPTNPR